jgi:hypothetical protein
MVEAMLPADRQPVKAPVDRPGGGLALYGGAGVSARSIHHH